MKIPEIRRPQIEFFFWFFYGLPSRSFGSVPFSLRSKLRLVEAAGVEPASEGIPLKRLRAYPGLLIFAWKAPSGQGLSEANLQDF